MVLEAGKSKIQGLLASDMGLFATSSHGEQQKGKSTYTRESKRGLLIL